MTHRHATLAAAALSGLLAVRLLAGCSGQPSASSAPSAAPTSSSSVASTAVPSPPSGSVAAAAWEALMSPQGEYAAYAAYTAVLDRFGTVEPYASIREAEARHIDALTRQLQRLGYQVPTNPYLGAIAAPATLADAATAWAEGEVDNVALYDRLLAAVNGDVALTRVFGNLRRASEQMHLPAFRAAAANGGTLTAAQMTELGLH